MCGFAGCLDRSRSSSRDRLNSLAGAMAGTLDHRGPDDSGVWVDAESGVALGHCRLSILDLSPEGHQPMQSASGRFVVVYNGELYNFPDLRGELEPRGHRFRGHSDTEVLLAAFDEWGIEASLQKFIGMFGLAVWDRRERALTLCRDRLGEKPLYYGWAGSTFLFGSELKAIAAHPDFDATISHDSLALFIRHNNVPAPRSIYQQVRKVPPGSCITLHADDGVGAWPEPVPYWSLANAVAAGRAAPFMASDREAIDALDSLLRDAVRRQMLADVPLGAFLSGGIDSSVIVALMQATGTGHARTFSIGFAESGYDEAVHAAAVARHLGTEHTELYVSADEARALIPELPRIYDEPFADSSQLPTILLARLAREHVTVALTGDAGDELFGGYNRYFHGRRVWSAIGWAPARARRGLAALVTALPPAAWDRVGMILPAQLRQPQLGDRIRKLAEVIGSPTAAAVYMRLISHWPDPTVMVPGAGDLPRSVLNGTAPHFDDFTEWMMYADTMGYLPDDILVKVDRAAMSTSLETRVPFLDHRVVEFAWTLPLRMKVRAGTGKWLVRQVLDRYVPRQLIDRPKQGFGVPLDAWLRGPLRDWAEELLDERRLREDGLFHPAPIRERWGEHLSGRRNWQAALWCVLVFQSWLDHSRSAVSRAA
jgi:asparagine synthase (glutamine-hydrolysing)